MTFYTLILRELGYFQLRHLRHPRYGSSTRSRLTITPTGNPGLIVSVDPWGVHLDKLHQDHPEQLQG
jgi:hypothetical protein